MKGRGASRGEGLGEGKEVKLPESGRSSGWLRARGWSPRCGGEVGGGWMDEQLSGAWGQATLSSEHTAEAKQGSRQQAI